MRKTETPPERWIIEELWRPLAGAAPGALDLRDDAALLQVPPGRSLVITQDSLVAGVHFFADDAPEDVAAKALRTNLSDICAKGAQARGYFMSLFLPRECSRAWLRRFAAGLAADQEQYGMALMGGDTVRTPGPLAITITMTGEVAHDRYVSRRGARPGDHVLVSGTIGDAALGLFLRRNPDLARGIDEQVRAFLDQRFLRPQPRTGLAALLGEMASAAMDVSDGLAGDLALLCGESGVGAQVEAAAVPLSKAARALLERRPELMRLVLGGGDDYELLCALPPQRSAAFKARAREAGVRVSRIGMITAGQGTPEFRDADGRIIRLERASYQHDGGGEGSASEA